MLRKVNVKEERGKMTGSGSNTIDDLFLLKFGGFKEMRFKNMYKHVTCTVHF